jgi:hypothetical protein
MAVIDDDDEWLKALAGRASDALPQDVRREIAALREAIKQESERDTSTTQESERGLERLLFRLRQDGLLEQRSRWKRPIFVVPLASAAVLLIAVSVFLFSPRQVPEPELIRGGQEIQIIEVKDLGKSLEEISETLRKAGVEPETYPLGLYRGLDASIPVEKRDALRARLAKLGVEIPAGGELRLEIREQPSRR